MGKRLDKIQQIQKLQQQFTKLTSDLFDLIKDEPVTDFKKKMLEYIIRQGSLNTEFSVYILNIIPQHHKSDVIDKDFNKIVKPLEKDFGGKND